MFRDTNGDVFKPASTHYTILQKWGEPQATSLLRKRTSRWRATRKLSHGVPLLLMWLFVLRRH